MTKFERDVIKSIRQETKDSYSSECCRAKLNPVLVEVKSKVMIARCSKCGAKLVFD